MNQCKRVIAKVLKYKTIYSLNTVAKCRNNEIKKKMTVNRNIQTSAFSEYQIRIDIAKTKPEISFSINHSEKLCSLKLGNSESYEFPHVWLRDNCQCPSCFHEGSSSRIMNWQNLDLTVTPVTCTVNQETSEIFLKWSDGHESTFKIGWLKVRNFSKQNQKEYLENVYQLKKQLWDENTFKQNLEHYDYMEVLESDVILFHWLKALSIHGVVMLHNAPNAEDSCRKLADRVGFIRRTHYGEEFIVRAKQNVSNVAYLPTLLQMHTDLPYYNYVPGCNLLHCLVQAQGEGGDNLLADGFFVANQMRINHPQEYKVLNETLVNWFDIGNEDGNKFHSLHRAPVICTSLDGEFQRISHSVPQRDSFFNVHLSQVDKWYHAMKLFVALIQKHSSSFKTKPGDVLTFDNTRLVHGRTAYVDSVHNTRHIVGAYLDWDEIYSRLRVLQATFV